MRVKPEQRRGLFWIANGSTFRLVWKWLPQVIVRRDPKDGNHYCAESRRGVLVEERRHDGEVWYRDPDELLVPRVFDARREQSQMGGISKETER